MKPLWIELVDTGVANRFEFDDHELIEMNWRLTKYPELYNNVLQHELRHDSGNFKFRDFVHDMKSRTPGLFKFMGNHISAWTQILPFYWDKKRKSVVYDVSAIMSWSLAVALSIGIFYSLRWLL
tara:strand:+ start:758 stop:1129 length:372 start_codon:yes stop_codon:yes gene_type:complete